MGIHICNVDGKTFEVIFVSPLTFGKVTDLLWVRRASHLTVKVRLVKLNIFLAGDSKKTTASKRN